MRNGEVDGTIAAYTRDATCAVSRAEAEAYVSGLSGKLGVRFEAAGELRRKDRYVSEITLVLEAGLDPAVDISRELGMSVVDPVTLTSVGWAVVGNTRLRMRLCFGNLGSLLMRMTGSRRYVDAVRRVAYAKGMDLSRVYDTEHELCEAVGIPYVDPELRTVNSNPTFDFGRLCVTADSIPALDIDSEVMELGSESEHRIAEKCRSTGRRVVVRSIGLPAYTPRTRILSMTGLDRMASRLSPYIMFHVTGTDDCPDPVVLNELWKAGVPFVVDRDEEAVLTARKALLLKDSVVLDADDFERRLHVL